MLSLWVPELPFQLACARDRRLDRRPLAFLSPQPGSVPSLWLVNRQARSEGVGGGMPLDMALRFCRSLEVLDPMPNVWAEAQVSFSEFLLHWTPQGKLGRMGEALIEVKGLGYILGDQKDAAYKIMRELSISTGWRNFGGLSDSATAAHLASRVESGLECISGGHEASFLAPYSIKALPEVESNALIKLNRLGLHQVRDLQPVPIPTLIRFMPPDKAKRLSQSANGRDKAALPMLADKPNESRHSWRVEPPSLPEDISLASWLLDKLWAEKRSPRSLKLAWWDIDGKNHRLAAGIEGLSDPPMVIAKTIETAFRDKCERRILIHRFEAHIAWGLGRARGLFSDEHKKLDALEPALAKLRQRFPDAPVLPGWAVAATLSEVR